MKKFLFVVMMIVSMNIFAAQATEYYATEKTQSMEFAADKQFDIYYEVSETFEVDKLTRVFVVGVVKIGAEEFLNIVNGGNITQGDNGYINLKSIKAILPTAIPVKRKNGAASFDDSTS